MLILCDPDELEYHDASQDDRGELPGEFAFPVVIDERSEPDDDRRLAQKSRSKATVRPLRRTGPCHTDAATQLFAKNAEQHVADPDPSHLLQTADVQSIAGYYKKARKDR